MPPEAYLRIVSGHVHPFMATMYPSSDGYFQQDNAPCHKAPLISNWFLEHDNEFTVLKWPSQSQLNRASLGCGGTGASCPGCASTNLHQLQDAILSIWTNISEECFQHLLNQCHIELRQF